MLYGHIDVVTSSGYVDGWAYDADAPSRPLALSIFADGQEVAYGIANRYRGDLADAGIGIGWCAFRFRTLEPVGRLVRVRLSLVVMPSKLEISHTSAPSLQEDNDLRLKSVDEIVVSDTTLVSSIEQLRGCAAVFSRLIQSAGLEVFIRAAYIYVLNRSADPTGLDHYGRMMGNGEITPFGLLEALSDSDEFRSAPRMLIAPTQPGFIFGAI